MRLTFQLLMSGYRYLYKNVVNHKILLCKNVVICKNNPVSYTHLTLPTN